MELGEEEQVAVLMLMMSLALGIVQLSFLLLPSCPPLRYAVLRLTQAHFLLGHFREVQQLVPDRLLVLAHVVVRCFLCAAQTFDSLLKWPTCIRR